MLTRVYLAMRLFTRFSIYRSAFADKACANVGIEADTGFSLKCIYLENPFQVLGSATLISIIVFGFALRLFEMPYYEDDPPYNVPPDDDSYQDYTYIWNGMWVVVVTMASIGYGDFYPCSHMGRFIIIFATFWGVFIVSMCIVSVANYKQFYATEKYAFKVIHRLKMRHNLQVRAANMIGLMYKLTKIRKDIQIYESNNGALAGDQEYEKLIMDRNVQEVHMNRGMREFKRYRDLLKINAVNRNLMIQKLIDKVDEDLGAVSFILGSIKEIEIKTDFLIKEQEEDLEQLKELERRFRILEIMLNRFDKEESKGQRFIKSISYEPLNPSEKEMTFEDLLHKNRKKRERAMGEKSSRSSGQGSDTMIANRLEQLQRELNKRLNKGNLTSQDDEDIETSKKISDKIAKLVNDGLVNVQPKQKLTEIVNEQDDDITAANQGMINNIMLKTLDQDKKKRDNGSKHATPTDHDEEHDAENGGDMLQDIKGKGEFFDDPKLLQEHFKKLSSKGGSNRGSSPSKSSVIGKTNFGGRKRI
ncbi:hypothetical protein FGO68_gene9498 [Halteria grandinella]|uniref:Potassium channel domain-containing protein n=1 Tax=Halteria grandinella TaxID=5974 RepID=A0A8J8T5I1_HALGN|nr:hypothetical protein FGO68_gene9498 [Halteria grandinella]